MTLTFKRNTAGTLQAAHSGSVRIGYVEESASDRWLWSLNTIQPKGGRASGIEDTEEKAKGILNLAWESWVQAAGLKIRSNDESIRANDVSEFDESKDRQSFRG